MLPSNVDGPVAQLVLRALKMVATASRGIHETERQMLEAAAKALHTEVDLDALTPLEPEEALALLPSESERARLLESMMLMALMDQEVDREELALIDRFARAFGVDEPRLKNLHQYVDGQHVRMKLDVLRRSYLTKTVLSSAWAEGGFAGVWKAFAPRFGKAADPELAWKYKQLGLLPEGSLGRIYWAHCTSRKFSFPGEPYGFPWQAVHDIGHVLGDHDTDPHGEIEQAAFEAGYMRRDPFFFIFTVTMIFHLGFPVLGDDYIGVAKGSFQPAHTMRAYERGLATKIDLTEWDFWPHVARPIDDVRAELGIPPK
jgi:uncharacterized tellurite resistance protein B-like protein